MEQAKKDAILVAAATHFAKRGFKKTTIDSIAQDAGVAKGTVYLMCTSKEDLFYQVLHREVRAWVAEILKVMDPRAPADQLLMTMAARSVTYLDENPLVRDLLFGRTMELLPDWRERLHELRAIGATHVQEVLRLGIRQGIFRPEIDVEAVATILQDLQLATNMLHSPRERAAEELAPRVEAAFDLILNGLRKR
jgi:TetR/AcrR family fatty acid metabolism transcriptional regulator